MATKQLCRVLLLRATAAQRSEGTLFAHSVTLTTPAAALVCGLAACGQRMDSLWLLRGFAAQPLPQDAPPASTAPTPDGSKQRVSSQTRILDTAGSSSKSQEDAPGETQAPAPLSQDVEYIGPLAPTHKLLKVSSVCHWCFL